MKSAPYIKYENKLSLKNKAYRLCWNFYYSLFFRPFYGPLFNNYRIFVLILFGAKIGKGSKIKSNVKIWSPKNLVLGDYTCVGDFVIFYNPAKISIGNRVTISQYAHLCSASHNIAKLSNDLIIDEIHINDLVWLASDTFVGMGVKIGEGSVIGARGSVFKDLEPWFVYAGNPVKKIKERKLSK